METDVEMENTSFSRDNASSKVNDDVYLELYTVVITCTLFLIVAVPGLLANVFVLLSTRSKKSIRSLQYGLHYTLFCVNIAMSLVWLPLHAGQVLVMFSGQHPHAVLCYINTALFHFCLGCMACLSVSLGVLHLNHLSTTPMNAIRALVSRSIPASIATALLLTGLALAEQPFNLAHDICATGSQPGLDHYRFWYSFVNLLLSIAYTAILLIMMVLLWLAIQAIRQRIGEMLEQARATHRLSDSMEDYPEDTYEGSREEPSKHSSVTFKEPEISEAAPSKNGITRTNSPSPKALKFKCGKDKESDDDDDDMFEKKMRMRMQKSGSGRRHTVANIGLGDSLLASKRRGSLEVPQRSPNYNYIRKWSVDITALQAQLENPRHHSGSFPFNDLGILPEKVPRDLSRGSELHSHEEEEEEADASAQGASDKLLGDSTKHKPVQNSTMGNGGNPNGLKHQNESTNTNGSQAVEGDVDKQDMVTSNNVNDVRASKPLLTHVPSIIIDENSQNCVVSKEPDTTITEHQDPGEASHLDDDILRKFHKQLRKTKHYVMFYLLTLLFILPFCVVQMFQSVLGAHLSINLAYSTASVCVVNTVIQPLYLSWIDTRLRTAMYRLWNKMTQWKCVCYCNIGKGKKFFGKPVELEDKIQPDVSSNVC